MRVGGMPVLPLLLAAVTSRVFTQTPTSPAPAGPTFDVVSIKRNTTGILGGAPPIERPDGGFRVVNVAVMSLISRAYPPAAPIDMIGLPDWARTERYDVSATSTLAIANATPDARIAMLRALLADRLKLAAHVEKRELPVYDLVLARSDGRLGSGIKPTEIDCAARIAADHAAAATAPAGGTPPPPQRPDFNAPPPPCMLRMVGAVLRGPLAGLGDAVEGDTTMANLATLLKAYTGRDVVDKTGMTGFYRVTMNADLMATRRGPGAATPPDAGPSIFTALQEQLGMKLQSARAEQDRLVIDHLERPTED